MRGIRRYVFEHRFLIVGTILLVLASTFAARTYTEHEFRLVYSLDTHKDDQEVISLIDGAHSYIYFAIYTFTKSDIADALVKAKKRGVAVEGLMDASEAKESYEKPIIAELLAAGVPLETEMHADGIMHIKAVVTDSGYASGSYNWTASATDANDELLEIGTDGYVHDQYLAILKRLIAANKGGSPLPASTGSASTAHEGGEETASATIEGTYDYTAAKSHIGEHAAVTGRVLKVQKAKNGSVFFDYCSTYKNCPFSAVIFSSAASGFGDIAQYAGKTIAVTGDIKSYQGAAEIVIDTQGQISANSEN